MVGGPHDSSEGRDDTKSANAMGAIITCGDGKGFLGLYGEKLWCWWGADIELLAGKEVTRSAS